MNKENFTKRIADKTGTTYEASKRFVAAFIDVVTEAFNEDERVELQCFGTFSKHTHQAHKAYNFKEGKTIELPSKDVLKFKASSLFNKKK